MSRAYRFFGCLASILIVCLACADSPPARTPLFVNKPITPAWAPLWDWEQPRNLAFQHRVVEHLTGVQGVGSCCAEGVSHDGYRLHLCFAPGTPRWYVEYVSRLIFGDFLPAYDLDRRWSFTSFGSTGSQGNPIQLRWSFVPDGTLLPGVGGGTAPSNLIARTASSAATRHCGRTNSATHLPVGRRLQGFGTRRSAMTARRSPTALVRLIPNAAMCASADATWTASTACWRSTTCRMSATWSSIPAKTGKAVSVPIVSCAMW